MSETPKAQQVSQEKKQRTPLISLKQQNDALRDGKVPGYQCTQCGHRSVNPLVRCPNDGSTQLEEAQFATTGKIATYTIQRVASEQFINDVPFAWVVVELDDGGPRVTGWIPYIGRPDEISIGQAVKLTTSYKPGFMFEKA